LAADKSVRAGRRRAPDHAGEYHNEGNQADGQEENARVRGHRAGLHAARILDYIEARKLVYLPSYLWVLENRLPAELEELQGLASEKQIVLLDYETNSDVDDVSHPRSHASLAKRYLEGEWPV
jgi:hypothetical protein